jgi:tetratricopeptide (TPR) repeat protein
MVAASPSQPEGYLVLGRGVYGTTRSTDAVRTLIQERLRRTGENADEVRSSYEFSLAVLDGDFTGALANSTKLEAAVAPLADARRHGLSLMELFEVHFELGESAQARRVAEKFRDLAVTWRPDSYFDSNIESARLLYLSNAITADELERLRTKAMGAQHEVGFIHSSLMTQWLDNYVQTIVSPKDALAAEQARPPNAYADYLGHEGNIDASLGHMQLLRGHYAEAIALLSSAGSSCSVLAHPFWYVRSKLWLGDAFEAVGQHEEACAQFQAVIYHWGNEPRSVSAAAARRRLAKCTTARFERNRP